MRRITYAGDTLVTTDDVAQALITLTAAIANERRAEAVRIPIALDESGASDEAELVIGAGNDVLSAPVEWHGVAPDFTEGADALRDHPSYPRRPTGGHLSIVEEPQAQWDPDLDGFRDA